MSSRGSRESSHNAQNRTGTTNNQLPARSDSMIRRAFPGSNTAIDPNLDGNSLASSLPPGFQRVNADPSVFAELLDLINKEERASRAARQVISPEADVQAERNTESHMYEGVAQELPDEASYRDYLLSEMEKLEGGFNVNYDEFLQRQNYHSLSTQLPTQPSQQSELAYNVNLYGPTTHAMQSGQSYEFTGASDMPEIEASQEFSDQSMMGIEGLGFNSNWDPVSMPAPPLPQSMAQRFSNYSTGFNEYFPAAGHAAMNSLPGLANSYMNPHFQAGPTSYPMQILQQTAPQINQMQYMQMPTRPDGGLMQAPQVSSNSAPRLAPLMPCFPPSTNAYTISAPGQPQKRHTATSDPRQQRQLKRDALDS